MEDKKPDELPTHVEEVDALRLQVAKLKCDAAFAAFKAAEVAYNTLASTVIPKYAMTANDSVDLDTFAIKRAQ